MKELRFDQGNKTEVIAFLIKEGREVFKATILYRMTQHIAAESTRVIENLGGRIQQFAATRVSGGHAKRVISAIPNPNKLTFKAGSPH